MSLDRWRDWLEEALDDLNAAKALFQVSKWSKACLFSHQAVEKALKALLIKKLGVYIHTHSIARLVDEVSRVLQLPPELVEKVKKLDKHYIPTRYPNA